MLGTILGNVDRVTLRIEVGTDLHYLDGYFDGSGLLLGVSIGSTDVKVLGYCEGI